MEKEDIFYVYRVQCQEQRPFNKGVYLLENSKKVNKCCHELVAEGTLDVLNEFREWKSESRRYIAVYRGKGQILSAWEVSVLDGNLRPSFQILGEDVDNNSIQHTINHVQFLFSLHDPKEVVRYLLDERDLIRSLQMSNDSTIEDIINRTVKFIREFNDSDVPAGLSNEEEIDFILDNNELFSEEEFKKLMV